MSIDLITALESLGYTKREASFLYLAGVHSGYFVRRQFDYFIDRVAGAIAQTVWNLAAGHPAERGIKDADLVYFDAADLSAEAEAAHECRIRERFGDLPCKLDVKNEARVHLWYEARFG